MESKQKKELAESEALRLARNGGKVVISEDSEGILVMELSETSAGYSFYRINK